MVNCHLCKKKLLNNKTLQNHLSTVHRGVPVQCHLCDKTLRCNKVYKEHLKTHYEPKLECNICGKMFVQTRDLNRHQKTVYYKDKKYQCIHCEYSTERLYNLNRHVDKKHPHPNEDSKVEHKVRLVRNPFYDGE